MRKSGILLHVSSLPSPYGIGTLGKSAYDFIDFLKSAGQKCWQMLPINPTGYGDSPYQSLSTFAGNHYLIDLDMLIEDGLLLQKEADAYEWGDNPDRTDYSLLYRQRLPLLRKAYKRFDGEKILAYQDFVAKQQWWLKDFALFMALKAENNQAPWTDWDDGVRLRKPDAIKASEIRLKEEMEFHYFIQYIFFSQWKKLHEYAATHKRQCQQSADGGKGGGKNLRNGFAQGRDRRVSGIFCFVFINKAVAQNDGIVYGKCQLQHHGNGIGNEADRSENEVASHIQKCRHTECDQQNGNFRIGTGGQDQHNNNDNDCNDQDDTHFLHKNGVHIHTDIGVDAGIVAGKICAKCFQRFQCQRV